MVQAKFGQEGGPASSSPQLTRESQAENDLNAQLDIVQGDPTEVPAFLKGVFINGKKRSYFMLDTETDIVHFFRTSKDNKPYQSMSTQGGVLNHDTETDIIDEVTGERQPAFKFQFMNKNGKKKGNQLTVVPENGEQCTLMVNAYTKGVQSNQTLSKDSLKQSQIQASKEQKKAPVTKRSGLTRMSVAINNAPEILTFSSQTEDSKKYKKPKNIVSGVGYGGMAFCKGIFFGITGLVTEPYKGAKKKGAKGAAVGVGKGLIGLVAKPVAGTVGLVGHTVQGTISTPGTIYSAATKKSSNGAAAADGQQGSDNEEEEKKSEDDNDEMLQVAPVDRDSEVGDDDDGMSMRTESIAIESGQIDEYNREKAQMHEQLQALKESADNGDPNFQDKLDQLIAKTGAVENIEKTNQVQSILEEGETHVLAREEYHRRMSELQQEEENDDDSDEFQDAIDGFGSDSDDNEEAKETRAACRQLALNWAPFTDMKDDFRHPDSHKDGGFPLNDAEVIGKYRNAFKDIVKQLGRTIFSGKFNIGSVSFPISCMSPNSILYLIGSMAIHSPIYMTRAALATDPIERMKFVLTTSLSFLQPCHVFDKPLNPILGETLQGAMADGTTVCLEQICHHPPISFINVEGPDGLYKWSGYSSFTTRVHMNSIDLDVKGGKTITFADGGRITYTPHQDKFYNSLWGTLVHTLCGTCDFKDEANGIEAQYTIGIKKGRDYFKGEIKQHGKVVSTLTGSYMGYIDFDGVRYWDIRKQQNFEIIAPPLDKVLSSDWRNRSDTRSLQEGDIPQAQINKDDQENLQRADRKLREAAEKRRNEGGPKYDYSLYPGHPLHNR